MTEKKQIAVRVERTTYAWILDEVRRRKIEKLEGSSAGHIIDEAVVVLKRQIRLDKREGTLGQVQKVRPKLTEL